MKELENYVYKVFLPNHFELPRNRRGWIFERQEVLMSISDLVGKGDSREEIPMYRPTDNSSTGYFYTENILGDFLQSASIEKAKKPISANLHQDFFRSPLFMGRSVPCDLCISIEEAQKLFLDVYKVVTETNGLADITLSEFERLCAFNNVPINYTLTYSPLKEWLNAGPISEDKIIKNETQDYASLYKYECKNAREILFAILHFCISNGYILKKCKLCGRYFIPLKPQENFCTREFSYVNWAGVEKKYVTCKYAKKSILQTIKARKATVADMLDERIRAKGIPFSELKTTDDINYALDTFPANREFKTFDDETSKLAAMVKKMPTIENLMMYEKYVFVDCQKYYKRYERKGPKQ